MSFSKERLAPPLEILPQGDDGDRTSRTVPCLFGHEDASAPEWTLPRAFFRNCEDRVTEILGSPGLDLFRRLSVFVHSIMLEAVLIELTREHGARKRADRQQIFSRQEDILRWSYWHVYDVLWSREMTRRATFVEAPASSLSEQQTEWRESQMCPSSSLTPL